MQRISNSLFEAINKVTSGQALNEATDGEKTPVKKGEGHKPAWLLAAEIRAEKKEGKIKENMEMPEAPEPEDKIEAPSLNDKIKAMAMKKAAQTDNGNSVQALSARGPGADVKEEIENEDECFELSEATGNTEKRHLDSIIKMKDLEKASKKNTKMGRMADMLHTHAKDSFEDGDHKKIDKIHKFYHGMVDANKKDKSPESDILKGSKNVFKEETITEKEKWIADAIKKPGAETAAAKKAGMSVHAYAEKHKDDSGKAGKRARLALTLEKLPRHYGKRNEEVEELDEASGNNEKRHLDSIIKMKEVKKSKHDMAPSIHDHMEDALEKGNHKKIDDLHKVFKHVSEEVEMFEESSEELTPSKHGSFSVNSKVTSPKEGLHKKQHVGIDTLVHKGNIQHKDNSKPSKFEIHNHVNRGLIFKTHHSDEEKQAIKQHLIKNKMAGKGTEIYKEEVEKLTEGKMDKMTLSGLWHKHAQHQNSAENGYGGGEGGQHSHHAATAIENHVRKHYGNKVADDMLDHSDHHVARVEYAGRDEYEHHEKEGAKLRAKHKISGDLLGPDRN